MGLFHWGNQWRQISIGNEHSKLSSAPRRQPNHPSNTAGSYLYNNGSPLPNRRIGLSGATARSSLRTRSHTDLRQLSQQQCQQQVQPKDIRAARLGYVDKTAALKALAQYVEVPNTKDPIGDVLMAIHAGDESLHPSSDQAKASESEAVDAAIKKLYSGGGLSVVPGERVVDMPGSRSLATPAAHSKRRR